MQSGEISSRPATDLPELVSIARPPLRAVRIMLISSLGGKSRVVIVKIKKVIYGWQMVSTGAWKGGYIVQNGNDSGNLKCRLGKVCVN